MQSPQKTTRVKVKIQSLGNITEEKFKYKNTAYDFRSTYTLEVKDTSPKLEMMLSNSFKIIALIVHIHYK